MDIAFFGWFLLSAIVASAANSRGRTGSGWLLLSIIISPLLTGLLLFTLPRTRSNRSVAAVPAKPAVSVVKTTSDMTTIPEADPALDRIQKPAFEPDGLYGGIPYKVSDAGAVEVMLAGGRVRFRSMEHFLALAVKDPNLGGSRATKARPDTKAFPAGTAARSRQLPLMTKSPTTLRPLRRA